MLRQDIPIKAAVCAKAALMRVPVSGSFELTPRCSLNCKMCYIRMTPEEMRPLGTERTVSRWVDLAQQAKQAGMVFLLLTGGEPLVYSDFFPLLQELSQLGLSIDINTNGTLIDDKAITRFLDCPPAKFNITLYGTSRDTYARLCGDGSAYDRTVYAIDALRQAGLLVSLNATLTPENVCDTETIADFAKERGLNLKLTSLVVPPQRRGGLETAHRLSAEAAGQAAARGHFRYFGAEAVRARLQGIEGSPADFLLDDCVQTGEEGISCLAGRSQFWVAWNGEMYPCCMMPQIKAKPFETGFAAAWEQISRACACIRQTPQCTDCALKSICPSCAALQYAETNGDAMCRPEYLCRMSESYRDTLRILTKE